MAAIVYNEKLELGVPDKIRETSEAYLVVALENRDNGRLHEDVETVGELLGELGATDGYVREGPAARKLIEAREKAFWTAKAAGADDVIDVVVPRTAMPQVIAKARVLVLFVGVCV